MKAQDAIFLSKGEGHRQNVIGTKHVTKISPVQNSAAFLAIEITIPPRCGPPLHTHEGDSECFYVLEGEITFATSDGEVKAGPGEFCYLPAGGAHAFCNESDVNAKAFVVVTPGINAHHFFEEVDNAVKSEADLPKVFDIGARHGLTIFSSKAA